MAVALRLGSTDKTMVRVWVAGKNCVIPLLHAGRVILVAVLSDSLLGLSLLFCCATTCCG